MPLGLHSAKLSGRGGQMKLPSGQITSVPSSVAFGCLVCDEAWAPWLLNRAAAAAIASRRRGGREREGERLLGFTEAINRRRRGVKLSERPCGRHASVTEKRMNQRKPYKTDEQWRASLTPEQYAVCRCSATEPPFSGKWYKHKEAGTYTCVACHAPLFASEAKYDSGSGWPSFFQPIKRVAVNLVADESHGMHRTEV